MGLGREAGLRPGPGQEARWEPEAGLRPGPGQEPCWEREAGPEAEAGARGPLGAGGRDGWAAGDWREISAVKGEATVRSI